MPPFASRAPLFAFALLLVAGGCSLDPQDQPASDDAGDRAFVIQALPTLTGRRARTHHEVAVLTRMAQDVGRAAVADVLMQQDAFYAYWTQVVLDDLEVQRWGDAAPPRACLQDTPGVGDTPALAQWVATHDPRDPYPGHFTMYDLVESALRNDTLSVPYAVNLFPMAMHRGAGAEAAARADLGTRFTRAYLNRNFDCVGCHKTKFAVVDRSSGTPDDRHFPQPFNVDFSSDDGGHAFRSTSRAHMNNLFRDTAQAADLGPRPTPWLHPYHPDFGQPPEPIVPFGIAAACVSRVDADGTTRLGFADPDDQGAPPVAPADAAHFAGIGNGEVTALFDELRDGMDRVGDPQQNPSLYQQQQYDVEHRQDVGGGGEIALGYLVAQKVAENLFEEVTGARLTMPHGYSRNRAQAALLRELTALLVSERWSLKAVLRHMVTSSMFNRHAPADAVGAAYPLPLIFDPWAGTQYQRDHAADTASGVAANSQGDLVRPHSPLNLLFQTAEIEGWERPGVFHDQAGAFIYSDHTLRTLGRYRSDDAQGFRATTFGMLRLWEFFSYGRSLYTPTLGSRDRWPRAVYHHVRAGHGPTFGDYFALTRYRVLQDASVSAADAADLCVMMGQPAACAGHTVQTYQSGALMRAVREYTNILLMSPEFLLSGLPSSAATEPALDICEVDGTIDDCGYGFVCHAYQADLATLGVSWSHDCKPVVTGG